MSHFALAVLALGIAPSINAQTTVPSLDQKTAPKVAKQAPYTPTVLSILNALTVDEKVSLAHGFNDPLPLGQAGYNPGVPRLGVPERRDADALGVQVAHYATSSPTRLGMAASFDRGALLGWGKIVGAEARALNQDLIYGPQQDLTRLVNWSRNNSTFGEDGFLSGQLGIQEINGIQSEGTLACMKHFAIYDGQANSPNSQPVPPALPTVVDDQTAHELYLKTYEYSVTEAKPAQIMASYQGFQITPLQQQPAWAADNPLTLTSILRGSWDYRGIVLSDYGATHSVHSLLSGLDQDYPGTGTSFFNTQLKPLVDPSSSTYDPAYTQQLDQAVARVLYGYERFGLLDGSVGQRPNIDTLKPSGVAVAETLAEESGVLLKNSDSLLPLAKGGTGKITVIGPTARFNMADGNQSERSRGYPDREVISPLQQLVALAPNAQITYAPGIDWIGSVVPSSALPGGLTRNASNARATRVDTNIDYESSTTSGSTPNDLTPGVTYTWTGTFNAATTDTYYLMFQQSWLGGTTVTVDGAAVPAFTPGVPAPSYGTALVPEHGQNTGAIAALTAGSHQIVIRAVIPTATQWNINKRTPIPFNGPLTFRFTYSQVNQTIAAAANAAKGADAVVVFADDNGTFSTDIVNPLAANQNTLVTTVAAANPNTAVVLNTGDPVLLPWVGSVKSVLAMWYPGQEGGTATAKLLLGQVNPSGKTPMTWPLTGDQTPFANHPERINGNGVNVPFSEGLGIGYRWYDQQNLTPLYAFGYGLSYTTFAYSDLQLTPNKGGAVVTFTVKNTGSVAGAEVPQVYANPSPNLPPGVNSVPRKLVGFDRVQLAPGESKQVTINVSKLELSYWSTADQDWNFAKGKRTIYVGASERDIRLQDQVNPQGSTSNAADTQLTAAK